MSMKTFDIELQRVHAMSVNNHGLVRARIDAVVQPRSARDDGTEPAGSTLTFTVENARLLMILLKKQLAEVDGRKARSQR